MAFRRALGACALLACLVLRFGGVEIARADPAPEGTDRFIRLNGEAIGTAVPADLASCQAGQKAGPAAVKASLQQLMQRLARQGQGVPGVVGTTRDRDRPVALNGSGYNYGTSLDRSARAR